jgi:HEPN domain-containing protein
MKDNKEYEMDLELFELKYSDAKAYHKRAMQFLKEGQCYSVVFNVAAVAVENYLIALCELYGVKPLNHNYTCLMDTVEEIVVVPEELNNEVRSLDLLFGICSIENYYHGEPTISDSDRVLKICDGIRKLFDSEKISSVRAFSKDDTAGFI